MCTNPKKIIVNGEEVTIKCRKCETCQRERASEWAIKLINEAKYHKKASFITLTFDNKILLDKSSKRYKYGANPAFVFNVEYSKEYFKKFMKRLRKKYKQRITFFHVGEHGEKNGRPHHHRIIFGENFEDDRKEMEKSKSGKTQFFSKSLFDLWACGRVSIQDINANNIIYIAQYSLKKYKQKKEQKYKTIFSFSNRSKMSSKWIRRHPEQILNGYLESEDGKKFRIPKSYLNTLKNSEITKYKEIYRKYEEKLFEYLSNNSSSNLLEKQLKKEEIWECREKFYNKSRDFE